MAENHRYEPEGAVTGPNAPVVPLPAMTDLSAPAAVPGLPSKYKSVEELAKAHAELERKLGQPKVDPAPTPAAKPAGDAPAAPRLTAEERSKFTQEVVANGKLSEESITVLTGRGYDRAEIVEFVDGRKAVAEAAVMKTFAEVGVTPESWGKIAEWAAKNVPEAEGRLLNEALKRGDLTAAAPLMRGAKAQYDLANANTTQSPFRRLMGGSTESGDRPFESMAQARASMRDPRYSLDPAYRDSVIRRMARTPDTVQ